MPIRSHLKGQKFDPEMVRVMGLAYELPLLRVGSPIADDIANDVVAHKIIEHAKTGERDPEHLCEAVLKHAWAHQEPAQSVDQKY